MDRSVVEAVKARLNIADVIRRYVDLKPVSGRWMGACPFHQETKPSMSVNEDEGFFYCFGCQASGDVIDFYKRINGLEFRDALEQLAAEAGVELKAVRRDPQADAMLRKKKLYLQMHEQAQVFFQRNLGHAAGQHAMEYLGKRGISRQTIMDFGLGYSPEDWHGLDNFLRGQGRNPEDGVEAGLLSKNQSGKIYDRFRGRLIFPIRNLSGKVIAFGGRILTDGDPKYLNSSDSPIYKKGDHLYGLNVARTSMARTRRAILTEGYMDVLSLHQFGYKDACGVLGTALTKDQVKRLAGFCSRVDLIFDGDNAGRKAALKSSRMILLQGVSCNVVSLPQGEDVDSLLQEHGNDGLDTCLHEAVDGLTFCLQTLRNESSPREIMTWASSFMSDLADDSLRAFYLPRLAQGLGLSELELRRSIPGGSQEAPRQQTPQQVQAPTQRRQNGRTPQMATGRMKDRDEKYLLKFPVQYPDYVPALADRGFERALGSQWARELWWKLMNTQPGDDIISQLNENEKNFYISCRNELRETTLSGRDLQREWEHICKQIGLKHQMEDRSRLKDELQKAQLAGDTQRVMECLRALNDSLGRDNEQY